MASIEKRVETLETQAAKTGGSFADREAMATVCEFIVLEAILLRIKWRRERNEPRPPAPTPPAATGNSETDATRDELFRAASRDYKRETEVLADIPAAERELETLRKTDAFKAWYRGD